MEGAAPDKCPTCASGDIVRNITMSQAVETGTVGLEYRKAGVFIVTEPLLADLSRQCGTILRFHVRNPGRKWNTKS